MDFCSFATVDQLHSAVDVFYSWLCVFMAYKEFTHAQCLEIPDIDASSEVFSSVFATHQPQTLPRQESGIIITF